MKVLIIEDEAPALNRLKKMISEVAPETEIVGVADSIESAVKWLSTHNAPELALVDIELADGQSFEIFNRIEVKCPVIFTTAYDEFALRAFKLNSIDYLLKPISREDLEKALQKYKEMKKAFSQTTHLDIEAVLNAMQKNTGGTYKSRFLVKSGHKLIPVSVEDIAYFHAHDKLVFIVRNDKAFHPVDHSLDELEEMLNPAHFFRANRQFIVSMNSIAGIYTSFNGKLKLTLQPAPSQEEDVLVSREKASEFKDWLDK